MDIPMDQGRAEALKFVSKMSLRELLDEYEQASHMVGYYSDKGRGNSMDWWCGNRDAIREEMDRRLGTAQ